MNISQAYILTSIVVLAILVLLIIFVARGQQRKPLTPLAGLSFGFVLAGIVFGENRILGYSLIGIGVLLAVIDIFRKKRNN